MTTAVEKGRRVINLRLKGLLEFLRRLHRKSPPDLWHFGLAVREVIAARMWRAMTGKLSAAEARRMVMEKQLGSSLKSPTPIPASWRESPFEKSNNQKKDHRTDRGNNDRIDHPAANADAQ